MSPLRVTGIFKLSVTAGVQRNLVNLTLRLHDDGLNRRRKSGVASSLFIPRLDKRFWEEICVHTVTQKCVDFDWVCMSGG